MTAPAARGFCACCWELALWGSRPAAGRLTLQAAPRSLDRAQAPVRTGACRAWQCASTASLQVFDHFASRRFASLRFTSPRFFLIPQNDQLPQNPDRSFSLPATVAAAAGCLGLILTLIFAAKGASLTNAEDALQDAQHPHSGGDKKFFLGEHRCLRRRGWHRCDVWLHEQNRTGPARPSVRTHAEPLARLREPSFASSMLPTKLGSGSLCRETFCAYPSLSQDKSAMTLRSSASNVLRMLLLLFYTRFMLVSLCDSGWQQWKRLVFAV